MVGHDQQMTAVVACGETPRQTEYAVGSPEYLMKKYLLANNAIPKRQCDVLLESHRLFDALMQRYAKREMVPNIINDLVPAYPESPAPGNMLGGTVIEAVPRFLEQTPLRRLAV